MAQHLGIVRDPIYRDRYHIAVDGKISPSSVGTTYTIASDALTDLVKAYRRDGVCYCSGHVQARHDAGTCSGNCYYCHTEPA